MMWLTSKLYPTGYAFHTWIQGLCLIEVVFWILIYDPGKQETKLEKAQLEYKHQVMMWVSKGVPFNKYLYVPEFHPLEFWEHEDEGNIFKVINVFLMSVLVMCDIRDMNIYCDIYGRDMTWYISILKNGG